MQGRRVSADNARSSGKGFNTRHDLKGVIVFGILWIIIIIVVLVLLILGFFGRGRF